MRNKADLRGYSVGMHKNVYVNTQGTNQMYYNLAGGGVSPANFQPAQNK